MALLGLFVVVFVFISGFLRGAAVGEVEVLPPDAYGDAEEEVRAVNVRALATAEGEDLKDLTAAGKQIYNINCASCHGAEGYGDGAKGVGLNPHVRNMHNSDPAEWYHGKSWAAMWTTLYEGARGSMANYRHLPEDDRAAVIHYISQWVPEQPALSSDDLASLPDGSAGAASATVVYEEPDEGPRLPMGFAMRAFLEGNAVEISTTTSTADS